MATNFQLKFFKGAVAPSLPSKGSIFFCTEDRTVRVYNGSEWEKFAGLVNANLNGEVLEITNSKGEVVSVNLAAYAKVADMTIALEAINKTLGEHGTSIAAAQKAADDAQAHSEGVAGDLATEVENRGKEITRVEGLVTAEETRAKAEEAKNAKAAKDADDKAANAQSYAEGVNTALGQEVERATKAEGELDGRIATLETAVGTGGSVDTKIDNAIKALDSEKSASSANVTVKVAQVDGKIDSVEVSQSDIASASTLATEMERVAAREVVIDAKIAALDSTEEGAKGRVTILEEQVRALNAATHFEGKVEWNPVGENKVVEGYESGDIVIYGNKEFIFDGTNWIELGDTTEEGNRLTALEGLVGSTSVSDQIDAKIAALDATVGSATVAEGKHVAVEVVEVDGKLTAVNVAESDIASAAKLSEVESEVDLNTAAVADYKTRIEALEGTAGALGTTYVKIADYNVDKAAAQQKHADLQGEIDAAEGRLDTVEAAITRLDGEQATQNQQIAAADAKGAQGIADAAAALAEAQKRVSKVSGDADVAASTTGTEVALSLNKATSVDANSELAVTSKAVYDALCWVEFN